MCPSPFYRRNNLHAIEQLVQYAQRVESRDNFLVHLISPKVDPESELHKMDEPS